jgi:hypothetical protein
VVAFATKRIPVAPDAVAPDGSNVRVLLDLARGGVAHFELSRGKHQQRLFTALSRKFGISYQDKAKCGGRRMAGAKQWMSLSVCALQSR